MAIKIKNSTIIDDSRNLVNVGISTVTSLSIGSTEVISSARQLKNISSLDAVTTATIETAIANAPNTFTDINVTGIATFNNINVVGVVTANTFIGNLTGTATSTTNIPNLSGDISSNNTVTTLATVNSNIGTFGGTGSIPIVTVNGKGLVTGVTTVAPNNGTLTLAVSGTGLSGSATFTANQSGNSTFTVTSNATSDNTNSTIVARNGSGGFSAGIVTATFVGNVTGDLNSSGVNTAATLSGTNLTYTNGSITNVSGTNLNYTGISTITNIRSTTLNNTGVTTSLGGFIGNFNSTGVSTATTIFGTTLTYTTGNITTINSTTGNIVSGIITNISGTNLNYIGISTITNVRSTNINNTGIATITSLTGTQSTYTNSTIGVGTITTLDFGTNAEYTSNSTVVATTSPTNIDSFSSTLFRSARVQVQITQGTNYQASDVLIIHDGSVADLIEYGSIATSDYLATFGAIVSGGNCLLRINMNSATSATVKVLSQRITV
jgi:hypothetical protein